MFGSKRIKFRDKSDALFTGRGFLLVTKVDRAPKDLETTSIRHIGWAGVDGPTEFAWWKAKGLEFHTPLTPLGQNWFFYIYGPDRSISEIYTGDKNHWFNHVHYSVDDVAATAGWYEKNLGMRFPDTARAAAADRSGGTLGHGRAGGRHQFRPDLQGPLLRRFRKAPGDGTQARDNRGQPGRSHRVLVREHSARVRPDEGRPACRSRRRSPCAPADDLKSFFVRGPDNVLIEIVEAKPIPDGLWR